MLHPEGKHFLAASYPYTQNRHALTSTDELYTDGRNRCRCTYRSTAIWPSFQPPLRILTHSEWLSVTVPTYCCCCRDPSRQEEDAWRSLKQFARDALDQYGPPGAKPEGSQMLPMADVPPPAGDWCARERRFVDQSLC